MSALYNEFIHDFLDSLIYVLDAHNYLLKGGQAVKYHLKKMNFENDARFSKDIDFSLSEKSFPINQKDFKKRLVEKYNSIPGNNFGIKENEIKVKKLPLSEKAYFGIRLSLVVREKKDDKISKDKVFFRDLESILVMVDFTVNEVVDESLTVKNASGIRLAGIPLIISEKFRALCSQLDECIEADYKTPRPKDFFDIFLLYNVVYKKKVSDEIKALLRQNLYKVFHIKNMEISLLKKLESDTVKSFHAIDFQTQVLDTLNLNSRFKTITFDQVYSDAMELLDIIIL